MENPVQFTDISEHRHFETISLNAELGRTQNANTRVRNATTVGSKLKVFGSKTKALFKRICFKKRQQQPSAEQAPAERASAERASAEEEDGGYHDESGKATRPALEMETTVDFHVQEKAGNTANEIVEGRLESVGEEGIMENTDGLVSVGRAASTFDSFDENNTEDIVNNNLDHTMEMPKGSKSTSQNEMGIPRAVKRGTASIGTTPYLIAHPSAARQQLVMRVVLVWVKRVLEKSKKLVNKSSRFFQAQFRKVTRGMMSIAPFLGRTFRMRGLRSRGSGFGTWLLVDVKFAFMRFIWRILLIGEAIGGWPFYWLLSGVIVAIIWVLSI